MKTTIVFAHPWHGSFNKAILDRVVSKLEEKGKVYEIIDLNKDGFNPVLEESDLVRFSRGESGDDLVKRYQSLIKDSDELVFIFPVWWFELPAILKGFIDKVMLKDFAYKETSTGLKGLLTHIRRTTVISTAEFPTWYLKLFGGNAIGGTFIRSTLRGIGLKKVKWINSSYTSTGSNDKRVKFLEKVVKEIA